MVLNAGKKIKGFFKVLNAGKKIQGFLTIFHPDKWHISTLLQYRQLRVWYQESRGISTKMLMTIVMHSKEGLQIFDKQNQNRWEKSNY